jgi:hypothetical protein
MKKKIYPVLLGVALLAGCAAPEAIHLNDEAQIAGLEKNAVPPPPARTGLEKADQKKIETEIFTWLLQRAIGEDGAYSAVFLKTDEAITTALMKKFPAHVPPLKPLWHLEVRPGQSPLDQDTGRPALILNVETLEPENGMVVAIGRWFAGEAASGFHRFLLKKTDDGWRIENVK